MSSFAPWNSQSLDVWSVQFAEGSTTALLTILRKQFLDTLETEIRALAEISLPTLIIWGR